MAEVMDRARRAARAGGSCVGCDGGYGRRDDATGHPRQVGRMMDTKQVARKGATGQAGLHARLGARVYFRGLHVGAAHRGDEARGGTGDGVDHAAA